MEVVALTIYEKLPGVLLPWYEKNKRKLPWREDNDPYHVWVSEIMLQQTRVEAVKGYYTRFLQAVPTVEALAKADDDLLQKLWEGLGYYSRIRNMKKAAIVLTQEYGGHFPQSYEEVRKLPGIGPYTAGAICSICFSLPTPAVDGNVLRVIARLTDDHMPVDDPAFKKRVNEELEKVYPPESGAFTQALMELGATICGPNRKPDCENCPCLSFCLGNKNKSAETLPVKTPPKEKRAEKRTVFIFSCEGRYALQKRPNDGLLAGLWQFPNGEGMPDIHQALELVQQMGLHPKELIRVVQKKHIFTHIRWDMQGIYLEVSEPHPDYVWMTPQEVETRAALPTAFRQFLDL